MLYPGCVTTSMNIKLGCPALAFHITLKAINLSDPLVGRKEELLQHFANLSCKLLLPDVANHTKADPARLSCVRLEEWNRLFYGSPGKRK